MPTAQRPTPGALLGWLAPSPSTGGSTFALNAAASRLALGFWTAEAKTLSKVRLRASAVAGTLAGTDCVLDLFSDTGAGKPNASLESRNTVTATPTGAAWTEWTGFTSALTANTQYWLVPRNANAAPATNNYTLFWGGGNSLPPYYTGFSTGQGWSKWQSTDSGATWVTGAGQGTYARLEFSDGTFAGFPIQSIITTANAQSVYSAREYGVRFTSPPNVILNVRALAMFLTTTTGTPTQDPLFKLYTGVGPPGSLLASTASFARGLVTSNGWYFAYFGSPQTIQPNTVCRLTLAENTQTDTSANVFRVSEYTIDNDANSKALFPLGGLQRTYFDGTTWTDTDTAFPAFALILDTDGEFTAQAAGGLLLPRGFTGGFAA